MARLILAAATAAMLLAAADAHAQRIATVDSTAGRVDVEQITTGLEHPWGIAFLPDGRALVTERAGRVRVLNTDGSLSEPLAGTPEVYARGQGGMLDVALHPEFASNSFVYLSFAEPGDDGASTALGRGRLQGNRIEGFEVLFRQQPKVSGGRHFGGRIAFSPDGRLFLTTGERGQFDPSQDVSNTLGTVIRLNPDGTVPAENPFHDRHGAVSAIWSYGHRNVEAAAFHPQSGKLWVAEMGPYGGDELNQPQAGRNYGWPVVSWGRHYDGTDIPDPPTHPNFADAALHWTPVISPSGLAFYTGDRFPSWRGSALIGGLSARALVRVAWEGGEAVEAERLRLGERIRDVAQAPDGSVYLLTDRDDGSVWRLLPAG